MAKNQKQKQVSTPGTPHQPTNRPIHQPSNQPCTQPNTHATQPTHPPTVGDLPEGDPAEVEVHPLVSGDAEEVLIKGCGVLLVGVYRWVGLIKNIQNNQKIPLVVRVMTRSAEPHKRSHHANNEPDSHVLLTARFKASSFAAASSGLTARASDVRSP